jgi:histidinol-phosphate/aromatic aminotransferase/cobyric acid decarboxylase-like protein
MSEPIKFLDLQAIYRQDQAAYDAAYRRVMDSGRWILGPELEAFEAEFAAFGGRRHAIGVGNGLDALALALQVAGIGPGDEVIVPAHTFIATWLSVRQCGATPRPVEPAAGSYNIDAAGVAAALTPKTRAVMPVHLYGAPADPAAIRALCESKGLLLLEDAWRDAPRSARRRLRPHGRVQLLPRQESRCVRRCRRAGDRRRRARYRAARAPQLRQRGALPARQRRREQPAR